MLEPGPQISPENAEAFLAAVSDAPSKARVVCLSGGLPPGLGNEYYEQAMEDFLKRYPKEPNMQLMMIDRYILKKEYTKAMDCINTVDSMINKDPFLDYFRGILLKMEGSNREAIACLERLNANMPEFGAGTVELISQYAGNNEQAKATALIRNYKKTSSFDSSSLENLYLLYPKLKREE